MVQVGMLATDADTRQKGDGKGYLLAILLILIASGLLPIFSFYSRFSTWGIWATVIFIIMLFYREMSFNTLLKPFMPYYVWLLCFIIWGLIVSPVPDIPAGIKAVVTTLIIAMAMAIVTSRLLYLKVFANAMQWLVFGNVLLFPVAAYYPKIINIIAKAAMADEVYETGLSRFAGLWGNPNMTGYMCLIAIVLSVWATPLAAWIGRLSSLPIIYLAVSRKSLLLLLMLIAMNVVIVQRHNPKRLLVWIISIIMLASLFLLSDSVLRKAQTRVASDSNLTRLLDITERNTVQAGGETRLDLLQEWLHVAANEPWYGYGFGAMGGRLTSEGRVISFRLPTVGSHNTYLGVFIEAGVIGFVAFILVLLRYARSYIVFRGSHVVRWALLSLFACNIIILVVSHNHLFSFEGKTVYALFFLLPTCPALRRYVLAS